MSDMRSWSSSSATVGRMVLDAVVFDGSTVTGRDRQGKPYTIDTASVVAERLLRDRHGRVGGKRRG